MKKIFYFFFFFTAVYFVTSCGKDGAGQPIAVGGELPSNYIIISDGAFSPSSVTVVNGSSITFVNRSGTAKGIYSSDSVVINKQNITDNTSYFFKKDTVGTINFKMAGKPSASGSITFTP
jgi:plastocyanin